MESLSWRSDGTGPYTRDVHARSIGWLLIWGCVLAVPAMITWSVNAGPRHVEINAFQNNVLGPILFALFWLGVMLVARGGGRAIALIVMLSWGVVWLAISNPTNKGLTAVALLIIFGIALSIQFALRLAPAAAQGAVAGKVAAVTMRHGDTNPPKSSTVEARLEHIRELREKGLVTDEEFARKRSEILDSV